MRTHRSMARAAALSALLCLACSDDSQQPFVSDQQPGRVQVAFNTSGGRWPSDPIVIDSARIARDTLLVFASYGGGCARHEFGAIAHNGWLESFPVQVGVALAHNANRDACDAWLRSDLKFDLAPLREAYRMSYGAGPGEMIIRLSEAHALGRAPTMIRYTF